MRVSLIVLNNQSIEHCDARSAAVPLWGQNLARPMIPVVWSVEVRTSRGHSDVRAAKYREEKWFFYTPHSHLLTERAGKFGYSRLKFALPGHPSYLARNPD